MWSTLALVARLVAPDVAPTPVQSDPAPLPFRWEAPASCPSQGSVRAAVEAHLGTALQDLRVAPWSVSATVSHSDEGWSLALVIDTPDGRHDRPLHDPVDCATVADTAALIIALALDPDAVDATRERAVASTSSQSEPESDPQAEPEIPGAEPAPASDAEPTPKPALDEPLGGPQLELRDVPLHFAVGLGPGLDLGTLRRVSPTGRLDLAWQLPRLRVGAHALFGWTPGFRIPAITDEISLWAWVVGVEAGPVFRVGAFEFPLVAGVEIGQLVIWPRELLGPRRQRVTWAAAAVTPSAAWVIRPWLALVARVGATVSLVRPRFAVEGIGEIHAPAPVGFRASLGFEIRSPLSPMKTGGGGNQR